LATSTDLQTIRRRIGEELGPDCYLSGAITALTTTTLTVPSLIDTTKGSGHYAGLKAVVHRLEAASAADYYRNFASMVASSGEITVAGGANYSDTTATNEEVELWLKDVRADRHIHPAINRAMEFIQFSTFVALSHLSDLDGDMAASTDTNWTDVGSPTTSAKATTARRTPYGLRSYNLINDAANEGTRPATLAITSGRDVRFFTIASVNVGGCSFWPYDITGSAAFGGTAITHSEEEPQLMDTGWVTAPSGCKEFSASMLGTTSTSDVFWNQVWAYKRDSLRINLPSYVSEEFKAPSIFRGIPRQSNGTGYYDAQSLEFEELKENRDYRFLMNHPDANPHAILLNSASFYDYPLFAAVRRPYADLGALSAETDTTTCPLHLLLPRARIELLDSVYKSKLPGDIWGHLRAKAQEEWEAASMARPRTETAEPVRLMPARRRLRW